MKHVTFTLGVLLLLVIGSGRLKAQNTLYVKENTGAQTDITLADPGEHRSYPYNPSRVEK